jgi:hypothetical protein
MRLRFRSLIAVVLALALLPFTGAAQDPVPPQRSLITLNPLGIPFEYFSGEFESRLSAIASAGLSVSYLGRSGNDAYMSVEGKFRFYPNEEWPRGFSIGLSTGLTRREDENYDFEGNPISESETRPTIGVIIDYNWLLGRTDRFIVGVGLGAKRILGSTNEFIDFPDGYPTARFQVGFLF